MALAVLRCGMRGVHSYDGNVGALQPGYPSCARPSAGVLVGVSGLLAIVGS